MWMGGIVPLGYEPPEDDARALAVNQEEAEIVRTIFRAYIDLGSVHALQRWLEDRGIRSKRRVTRAGRLSGGRPFSRGALFQLLRNRAKSAKMKDGTTHLAYKPEHAVDLDTGAVVAAELHPADEGDTTTLSKTLAKAEANLEAVDAAPTSEDPAECVADKGYHSRAVLRALNDSPWKTPIAAPKQTGLFALAR